MLSVSGLILTVLCMPGPASAAPIGYFSWDFADPFAEGLGPTFSFGNVSGSDISRLFVDTGGAPYDFLYSDGTSVIPQSESSHITTLLDPAISFAFIRSYDPGFVFTLFDADNNVLVNGLTAEGQTALVDRSPAPVPEPGALLLLGTGLAFALTQARRAQRKR